MSECDQKNESGGTRGIFPYFPLSYARAYAKSMEVAKKSVGESRSGFKWR
jgi:hypothetical protein